VSMAVLDSVLVGCTAEQEAEHLRSRCSAPIGLTCPVRAGSRVSDGPARADSDEWLPGDSERAGSAALGEVPSRTAGRALAPGGGIVETAVGRAGPGRA
jgi:hypothetical protein